MEYTVQKLASLAGVSPRTLRYYDEIDLLKPARINSSGYRIYGKAEVDRLQQILFYRELDLPLEQIKILMNSPGYNGVHALRQHRKQLLDQKKRLELLIGNIEKTIAMHEGRITMTDREKFAAFKSKLVEENELKYGEEIRRKFGTQAIERANKEVLQMSQEQYEEITELTENILATLAEACKTGDPAGELAQKTAELHRNWITFYWGSYDKKAHAGVAEMYVNDERFSVYYNERHPDGAAFLRDAILIYTSQLKE